MDITSFDTLTRRVTTASTRRAALRGFFAGATAVVAGGVFLHADEADARRKKKTRKKREEDAPQPLPPVNMCEGKNWCVDRSQTCGPAGGYGKCLVDATGDNLCAEILFQVSACTECEAPNCTNCRCALAAGGGDRCNNGANGYDFICVRAL